MVHCRQKNLVDSAINKIKMHLISSSFCSLVKIATSNWNSDKNQKEHLHLQSITHQVSIMKIENELTIIFGSICFQKVGSEHVQIVFVNCHIPILISLAFLKISITLQ